MLATVLDSFALIAYFRGETAGLAVKLLLQDAGRTDRPVGMTEVSYAEVKYMILRKGGPKAWQKAAGVLAALPIEFHPVDRDLADRAAAVKARFSVSLADACAVALAQRHDADLVTGDPELRELQGIVKIAWLAAE
jgi:predicted nucleic acid-binding protein